MRPATKFRRDQDSVVSAIRPQNGILSVLPTRLPAAGKANYDLLTFHSCFARCSRIPLLRLPCAQNQQRAGPKTCSKTRPRRQSEVIRCMLKKSVCEPTWVTEKRTITCTEYASEVRKASSHTFYPKRSQNTSGHATTHRRAEQRGARQRYLRRLRPVYDVVERQYQVCVPSLQQRRETVHRASSGLPLLKSHLHRHGPHPGAPQQHPPGLQGRPYAGNAHP